MDYKIMDGKAVAAEIKQELKEKVTSFVDAFGFRPGLAVILVGDDPASQVYVRNKQKACEEIGFKSFIFRHPAEETEANLLMAIEGLNNSTEIHGILVQLPLPKHIDEAKIINAISPNKDVDCFHPVNVGRVMTGDYAFLPCTPAGVIELLDYYNIDITGKECVVVGRSNIVGKPMSMLLLNRNGTVTTAHSKTTNLAEVCRRADILVSAVGKPKFITEGMVKEGAVVIDVGINRVDGKLCGDVDFENVAPKTSYITPVPGGCGPMTIAALMKNTFKAAEHFAVKY